MFEREIQFIYDFSHNKIKSLGGFITFSQLRSTDLHPAILQYISAEIDFYIFEDRQKLLKDSLFDYSGSKINSYFAMISEEIKKTKKFSLSYIEKLILHSITFTVNHLVTPNSLTSQFIFEEDKEKSSPEVKQILNYLYYFPHIKKIISSYLDNKNLIKITSEEFRELLKKIDNIGLEEDPEKMYSEALESMADFFNIGMSGRSTIPLIAVQNYLKDKNLSSHLNKLNAEFSDPEVTRYEIKDYRKLLVSVEPTESEPASGSETEEVLESDLAANREQMTAFEAVNEEEEATVDLKIKEGESAKVILDEETVEEIETDSGEKTGSTEVQAAERSEIGDKDGATAAVSQENGAKAPDAKKEEEQPETDSDIIDIDDERGVEGETVAEVMELAKEEKNIPVDESTEGREVIPEEDDDPVGIIDDAKDEGEPYKEQAEDPDTKREVKQPVGFQVNSGADKEVPAEDSKQIVPEETDSKPETAEGDAIAAGTAKEIEDEEPAEQESDSKDTLSYLLNDGEEAADEKDPEQAQPENAADKPEPEEISIPFEYDEKEKPQEKKNPEKPAEPKATHIDITSLLENKKITKVIDAIFDYDMEEFANTIELIGEAPSLGSANQIIDEVCSASQIPTSSKEAKLFKSIISDYYDRK